MITIFFVAMLIASTLSLSKGQCTANVMVAEIDSEGRQGTDRMKIAQITVNTPETAYVRPRICPQGYSSLDFYQIPCNQPGCSGTADITWFGTNVNNYVSLPQLPDSQPGNPSFGCCPIGMELWQYQGHDFKACAEQLSFNPSTSIFGFPPGASAPQPPVLLNLTSYKDA